MMRGAALALAIVGAGGGASQAQPSATLGADAIFARAKAVWRTRREAAFVRYGLLERYRWRERTHDDWWQVAYRGADGALALRRVVVADEDRARLRGASIGINFHIHNGAARADSLETNRDADAFPVVDPLVAPNASFGMVARARVALSPSPTPSFAAAAPSPSPSELATDPPLRELARVEAIARDYRIALAGVERVRDTDAYHLTLVPLRDPRRYRLRDVWVATGDFSTVRLDVDGLFDGQPYDGARWTVTYVAIDGREYVQQIKTDESLRFGADRYVAGLEYDFVQYAFPDAVPPLEFERLL